MVSRVTYRVQLLAITAGGTTRSRDLTFSSPPTGGAGRTPPLRGMRRSARDRIKGGTLVMIAAGPRSQVGTTFAFDLNEPPATLKFAQTMQGRRSGRRCITLRGTNGQEPECTATASRRTLTVTGHANLDKVPSEGALELGDGLAPGASSV
jgi:hypothetical protein